MICLGFCLPSFFVVPFFYGGEFYICKRDTSQPPQNRERGSNQIVFSCHLFGEKVSEKQHKQSFPELLLCFVCFPFSCFISVPSFFISCFAVCLSLPSFASTWKKQNKKKTTKEEKEEEEEEEEAE